MIKTNPNKETINQTLWSVTLTKNQTKKQNKKQNKKKTTKKQKHKQAYNETSKKKQMGIQADSLLDRRQVHQKSHSSAFNLLH